jgi:6,7-dimethyl-8-ribityllumazine synthase
VIARFYEELADELVRGAGEAVAAAGATHEIIQVPGAFEIPSAVRMAIASGRYDGYVALGCVIRGETTHYDYVCGESARGLNQLAMEFMAPIGYGILTVENVEQAWVRAAVAQGNKGRDAVEACLRMMVIKKKMKIHA